MRENFCNAKFNIDFARFFFSLFSCLNISLLSFRENVYRFTLAKPEFKLVMPAGSCTVSSMEYSLMVKCHPIKLCVVVMIPSTLSSVKLALESMYQEQCLLTSNQQLLVCVSCRSLPVVCCALCVVLPVVCCLLCVVCCVLSVVLVCCVLSCITLPIIKVSSDYCHLSRRGPHWNIPGIVPSRAADYRQRRRCQ